MGIASSSAARVSDAPAFGSLESLGARKKNKKPVLVLDPEELERAHQLFQQGAAEQLGEFDPEERHGRTGTLFGLAPMNDDGDDDFAETGAIAEEDLEADLPAPEKVLSLTRLPEREDDANREIDPEPAARLAHVVPLPTVGSDPAPELPEAAATATHDGEDSEEAPLPEQLAAPLPEAASQDDPTVPPASRGDWVEDDGHAAWLTAQAAAEPHGEVAPEEPEAEALAVAAEEPARDDEPDYAGPADFEDERASEEEQPAAGPTPVPFEPILPVDLRAGYVRMNPAGLDALEEADAEHLPPAQDEPAVSGAWAEPEPLELTDEVGTDAAEPDPLDPTAAPEAEPLATDRYGAAAGWDEDPASAHEMDADAFADDIDGMADLPFPPEPAPSASAPLRPEPNSLRARLIRDDVSLARPEPTGWDSIRAKLRRLRERWFG